MENVFALTSMEKGEQKRDGSETGQDCTGRGCGKGWTLAPTRCPPDMLARPYGFCATRSGRRRYNKNARSFLVRRSLVESQDTAVYRCFVAEECRESRCYRWLAWLLRDRTPYGSPSNALVPYLRRFDAQKMIIMGGSEIDFGTFQLANYQITVLSYSSSVFQCSYVDKQELYKSKLIGPMHFDLSLQHRFTFYFVLVILDRQNRRVFSFFFVIFEVDRINRSVSFFDDFSWKGGGKRRIHILRQPVS